jgi:hypothetical protein
MWAPPVGGTFWFQIFIQAPSLEIWRKTISGAEGGSGEEVGWRVLGYLLWKKLSVPRWIDAAVYRASMYEYFHGAVWQRKKLPMILPSTSPGYLILINGVI